MSPTLHCSALHILAVNSPEMNSPRDNLAKVDEDAPIARRRSFFVMSLSISSFQSFLYDALTLFSYWLSRTFWHTQQLLLLCWILYHNLALSLKHKVRIFALLVLYPGLALCIPTHNRNASASDLADGGEAEPKFGIGSKCNGVEPDSPNPSLSDSPKCCYRPDGNEEEDLHDISETVISASADFSQENVAANLISFITFYAISLSLQRLVAW